MQAILNTFFQKSLKLAEEGREGEGGGGVGEAHHKPKKISLSEAFDVILW